MADTTKPGLRERKKVKTRALIVETATRLFLTDGFDNVTLERIADECEVSVRTILRYFVTKEALALAAERDRLVRFETEIEQRDTDAVTFWRNFVVEAADRLATHADAFRDHLVMVFNEPSLFSELLSIEHRYEDVLAAAIQDEHPEFNPLCSRLLATVLVAGNAATVRQWVTSDEPIDPAVLVEVVDLAAASFQPSAFDGTLLARNGKRRSPKRRK